MHSDIWHPAHVSSYNGFKCFVFIDDFSKATWVYHLKSKYEVLFTFQRFYNMVLTQIGPRIKILRTDNGTKYIYEHFSIFCNDQGIKHETSSVRMSQKNDRVEWKNCHLVEVIEAFLLSKSCS